MAEVLRYTHWMHDTGESAFGSQDYCGACRQKLGGSYNSPLMSKQETPDDLEIGLTSFDRLDDREYIYWMYCPFCGAAFDADWWRNRPTQNDRLVDHLNEPGVHRGDSHAIPLGGERGHHLGSTDPDHVCWCDFTIERTITGCTIHHSETERDVEPEPEPPRQAMACMNCGLAGETPDDHFPQPPGLWDRPCPQCGEAAVWVTEPVYD